MEAVYACDGPRFCGTSYDVLDAIVGDTQQAGTTFEAITTYYANPSPQCGQSGTGPGWGNILWGSGSQCQQKYYVQKPKPKNSECRTCNGVSEPVDPAVGNVYKTEDDVVWRGSGGLRFQRFYNSADLVGSLDLSPGWRHSYSRSISASSAQSYSPYPMLGATQSTLYSDPGTACTSGFSEIRSTIAGWQNATTIWNGSACIVQNGGSAGGTLSVYSTALLGPTSSAPIEIDVTRDDGTVIRFPVIGGVPTAQPGVGLRLQQTASGYIVTDADDTVETYNASGALQSITSRGGLTQTMTYDTLQRLSTVTDSFGNMLTLGYNSQSRLSAVDLSSGTAASCLVYSYSDPLSGCRATGGSASSAVLAVLACNTPKYCGSSYDTLVSVDSDPAQAGLTFSVTVAYHASPGCPGGGTGQSTGPISQGSGAQCGGPAEVLYGYDSSNRLSTVIYADDSTKRYVYENTTYTNYLTGLIDESGNRLASWSYDIQGHAVSVQEAGGASGATLAYNTDGSVTVTDALGAVRTFNYQRVGDRDLPVSISGSQCPTCAESAQTSYDSAGFVSSRTDYNGNLTCYVNDATRGLELVRVEGFAQGSTCPTNLAAYRPASGTAQRKTVTTWHSSFNLPLSITEANRVSSFGYDNSGNLVTKTITDTTVSPQQSRTWTYTYDGFGRVLTVDGPRTDAADVTRYAYYSCVGAPQCGQLETVTDAQGHVTTFNSYNTFGEPVTVTDANGVVTALGYDARQRLASLSVAGETTSFSYFPTGLLHQITRPDGSYLQYTYDTGHRLTQVSDSLGNRVVYTVDAMGNHTSTNAYDPSNALALAQTQVFNTLSQLHQRIGSAGTAAVTTTFGYDSNGNQTSINAPLSRSTSTGYDALNRLIQVTDPGSGVTHLSYDTDDQLTSVVDPRSLTTLYAYNGFGDLVQLTSPDTGTTTNTFDSGGNLASRTDARERTGTFTYDALNRVTQIAYGDQTLTFGYDQGTNGVGHLTIAGDASHSLSWGYDPMGRVITKTQTVSGGSSTVTKSVSYGYTNGNLTSLITPSGQAVTYGYTNGQVTSVAVNGSPLLSQVLYEPFGPVSGWTWANNMIEARVYDEDGEVTNLESAEGFTLSHDNAFRITGITDTSNGALSQTYTYDTLDRLTSATGAGLNETWTYDANGNRLTQGGTASSNYTISPTSNQVTSISGTLSRSYTYTDSGQTGSSGGLVFGYTNSGRLSSVSNGSGSTSFLVNALGQRMRKSGTTVTVFLYDESGHLLGEYDGSGNLIEETIWLGDMPVATLQPSGTGIAVYYIHTDHLNAPRRITRPADNTIVWRWDSEPFGTGAANQDPDGDGTLFVYNLRFPGQYYDSETGLNYNGYRDFDPGTGRYVESDPIGLVGGVNTYAYVEGNPLSYVDPTGLDPLSLGGGYTGRIDTFNYGGESSFEIHVFDKNENEVGVYGPNGWLAKHGYSGRRPVGLPESVENACNGIAVDRLRAAGHLPPKGRMNIKGGRWMRRLLGWLPLIDAYEEETKPSPQLACDIAPYSSACLDTQ